VPLTGHGGSSPPSDTVKRPVSDLGFRSRRSAFGCPDFRVCGIASSLGYRICTWTIDTRDWEYVNGSRRSTSSIRSIVRNSPRSAKASGVVLGHLHTNYPNAMSGIISDLHNQGLLFCRNRGPVGRNMPFPASCT
jgi:peptidoglycan-N-acetylglucosamine deacetylase